MYASVDGSPVARLPRDAQGRSYIDLYDTEEHWQSRVVVAEGLSNGEHRLRLVVGTSSRPAASAKPLAPSQCAAGSNFVVFDGFSVRDTPDWSLSGLVALAGILIISLVLVRQWRKRKRQGAVVLVEDS